MKLAAWAAASFHVTVKAADVLRSQTPAALAALLDEHGARTGSAGSAGSAEEVPTP